MGGAIFDKLGSSRPCGSNKKGFVFYLNKPIYFIRSSEINAYQKQIKVIPITSEMNDMISITSD